MTNTLQVRKAIGKMWLVSLLGIPFIVLAVDVLSTNRITKLVQGVVFNGGDPQPLELRDQLWAGAFGVVGVVLMAWGLWGLLRSKPVLSADAEAVRIELGPPLTKPTVIPWEAITDLGAGAVDDSGTNLPVLWLQVTDPAIFPPHPWGARMINDNTLAVLAADWETPAEKVADGLVEIAMATATATEEA